MQIEPREPDAMREDPESGLPPRWTRLRYVRCEACGAKALVAASQCPQCEEPLQLRDSFGQQVPLAHCQTCDLYYPRKKGKCIWCGTAPKSFPMAGVMWGTVAAVAFIGLVWGAMWARNSELAPPLIAPTATDTTPLVVVPKYSEQTPASSSGEAALAQSVARADSAASDSTPAANDADSAQREDVVANAERPVSTAGVGATPVDAAPSEPSPTPTPVDPSSAGAPKSSAPTASVPRASRPVIDNLPPPDTRAVPESRTAAEPRAAPETPAVPETRPDARATAEKRTPADTRAVPENRVARAKAAPADARKPLNTRVASATKPATKPAATRTPPVARAASDTKAPPSAKATVTRPAPKVATAPAPRRSTAPTGSARSRWVGATVRGWLRVRSGASHESRTIAMIGPDTRLQVGEVRDGWIRVRSAGATGWVEQQQLHKNSTFRRPRTSTGSGTGR